MTENEAIELLVDIRDGKEIQEFFYADDFIESFNVAINVLEKQIPKKPIVKLHQYGIIDSYFCPDCDYFIRSTMTRKEIILEECVYCKKCGQKLDWGDLNVR